VSVKVSLVASLVALAVLAGCLGQGQDVSLGEPPAANFMAEVPAERLPVPDFDFSNVVVGEHQVPNGHGIRALHSGSHGLEFVGFTDLGRLGDGRTAAFAAADVWTTYVAVSSLAGGVAIVDIADPANPRVVSVAESGMVAADVQFSDDGRYMFAGCFAGRDEAGAPMLAATPLSLLSDAGECGVTVWNVEDKANPRKLFNSETGTYHNLFTATINDTIWLFQVGGRVQKLVEEPEPHLVDVTRTEYMVHDLTVSRHPITGDWLMYTGGGEGGLQVYNINDPAKPLDVGRWTPEQDARGRAWHDQQPVLGTVGGRAILVGAGETGGGDQIPLVVLDITNTENITLLGEWIIPGKPENVGTGRVNFFTMGVHEYETWNGYVAIGHYHSGVWLIDVGTPERAANPVTLGYYIPDRQGTSAPFAFNPDVWGAYFDDRGYIVATDVGSGLYVLKFGATLA